ncbi:unnamed protein product, partial [Didymodactylos carnosus]
TCCRKKSASTRAMIIAVIIIIACGTAVSFNIAFIIQPSTCILTSSCQSNSNSTSIFSYTLQKNFLTVFQSLGAFSTYTVSQAKFLFQVIQLSVAGLCFFLNIIYIIICYVYRNKLKNIQRIFPENYQQFPYSAYYDYPPRQQMHFPPRVQHDPNIPRQQMQFPTQVQYNPNIPLRQYQYPTEHIWN